MIRTLAFALIIGALISACRLVFARPSDVYWASMFSVTRETDIAHLAMNTSMALMLAPWFGGLLKILVDVTYCLMALSFAALLSLEIKRRGHENPEVRKAKLGSYWYHLIASGAMVYAVLIMSNGPPSNQMPGMSMRRSTVAYVIAAAFLIDFLVTAVAVFFFPSVIAGVVGFPQASEAAEQRRPSEARKGGLRSLTRSIGVASVPHLIMDFGMIVMLVAMER